MARTLRTALPLMLLALAALTAPRAWAGTAPRFLENRGQWPAQAAFRLKVANAEVYFEKDRLTFHFINPDLLGHHHGHGHDDHGHAHTGQAGHAYQVIFEGSGGKAAMAGLYPYEDVTHFIQGNDPKQWASDVRAFGELGYEGIYPGIGARYYGHGGQLKYDLVIAPGADPSAIRMRYEGADRVQLRDGRLHVSNTFNDVTESRPVAFQEIGGRRVAVACAFTLSGTTVGFDFPEGYDPAHPLVIDPILIFSSYSGSTADNFGFTATYDNDGALYGGGISLSAGYPFVLGSYSNTFQGGSNDIAISKFSADGSALIWSTVIGGSSAETPNSMVVNSQGQLVVYGATSSPNFPTTAGAYDGTYNGGVAQNYPGNGTNFTNGSDIVVFVLNANGSALVGSTFLGGSDNDGLNMNGTLIHNYGDQFRGEVIVNANDEIYIASSTRSADIPTTVGVFDNTLNGVQDAYIAKLSANVSSLLWATYLGGNADDAGFSLKLNSAGEVLVTGGTQGAGFPATPGSLNPAPMGGPLDGYVARLAPDASAIASATYVGTSVYDQSFFVEVDHLDNVYIYGQTRGSYPVSSGVYSNNNGRQFVHKLTPDLSATVFSTVFGSGGANVNISPTAFLVDVCGRIYMSGWGGTVNTSWNNQTGNTNGMAVTANAFQSTTNGSDFYFMVLEADAASLLYATYFGGASTSEHVDGGTSRFNSAGVIHQAVCAGCGGSSAFPTTPGAWSTVNGSSNCNLGVIKLDMELASVGVNIDDISFIANPQGCAPVSVQFESSVSGNAEILWDFGDGNTSTLPNPLHIYQAPGVYQVMLIGVDSTSCLNIIFADTAMATLTVNGIADPADAGADREVCGVNPVVIGTPALAGYTYSWSPATGLSNPAIAQPTATPAQTQVYTLTVTDADGCQDIDDVLVSVFALQLQSDTAVCEQSVIQLSAAAPGNNVTWDWSPAGPLNDPTIPNPTATINGSVTFTVTVDNGLGCIDQQQVTVQSLANPVADAGGDVTVCEGQSATLSGAGGSAFAWSPTDFLSNPAIANPTATPAATITYQLTVTDSNGCIGTDDVTVTVAAAPTVIASADVEICQGGSTQLSASGANAYAWSPAAGLDNPNAASPTASPGQSTVYTVVGTDANGCTGTDSVAVSIFQVQVSDNLTVCAGNAVSLGVTGGVSWAWSPPGPLSNPNAQNPIAIVTETTTFTVTATAADGCSADAQVTVSTFPSGIVDAGPDQGVCAGASVTLFGSGGSAFQWTPATGLSDATAQSPVATPAATITYTYQVTDVNGCVGTDQVTVTVNQPPVVLAEPSVEICEGASVQLQAGGAFSYQWSPPDGLSDPASASPVASPVGTTTYTVIGTDANGCTAAAQLTVGVFSIQVTDAFAVCQYQQAQLGVTGGVSWFWSPSDILDNPLSQNPVATMNATTTFTVAVSNGQGCTDFAEVTVTVLPPPLASAGTDQVVCEGGSVTLNGTGGGSYQWSPALFLSDPTIANPTLIPQGAITYTLTVTDANGCIATDEVTVSTVPLPVVSAGPDTLICPGATVQLQGSGGISYQWSPQVAMDNPNLANPSVSPQQAVTYTVIATDANGCSGSDEVNVTVFAAYVSADTAVCATDSVQVLAWGGSTYLWQPADGVSDPTAPNPYLSPVPGNYTVTITSAFGCVVQQSISIGSLDVPEAAFEATFTPSCTGVLMRLLNRTDGADSYQWTFNGGTATDAFGPTFTFVNGAGPMVTLVATHATTGCTDSVTVDYSGQWFSNDSVEVFYPNVFTPNYDGMNDCFRPGFDGVFIECYELKVYNRWGALLFESVDGSGHCWDGRDKSGTYVPQGTYYFIASVQGKEHAGYVTLLY